jgi:quercetin dioxygenase-like cupin family protein
MPRRVRVVVAIHLLDQSAAVHTVSRHIVLSACAGLPYTTKKANASEEIMPVVKQSDIKLQEVNMEGVDKTSKANVIGKPEGWDNHTMRVFRIAPGGNTPHHQHDWEHINYVMKGKGTLTIGEQTQEIKQGDFALVPPGTMHQFRNPYDEDFEFICIVPNRGAY